MSVKGFGFTGVAAVPRAVLVEDCVGAVIEIRLVFWG